MRRIYLVIIVLLNFIISYTLVQGNYQPKQNEVSTVSSEGNLFTQLKERLLTADIRDVALKEVLQQISDQNGITFLLPASLEEEKIMVRFSNLEIDEGLVKILNPYNRIFIYKEDHNPPQPPIIRLTEVRIYPRNNKSKLKEKLISISRGSKQFVEDIDNDREKHVIRRSGEIEERNEKRSVKSLSSALKNRDPKKRLKAVKTLAKLDTVDAIEALSTAIRDKNTGVKKEAIDALKEIGKGITDEGEVSYDQINEDVKSNPEGEESPNKQGAEPTLTLASSGNNAMVNLRNDAPVRGVQFTIGGAKDVRTTSRTEGFFSEVKNGKVLLFSLSGKTIAPGKGPIAEVLGNNGSSDRLSGITIAE